MDLRTGPSAVERGTRARSLRGKILARPPSPCPHDHDRLRIPPAPPTRTSGTEKKESTVHRLSRACRPYATPSSNSSFDLDFCDARTAEDKSAKSNGVNKSAKVVLDRRQYLSRIEDILRIQRLLQRAHRINGFGAEFGLEVLLLALPDAMLAGAGPAHRLGALHQAMHEVLAARHLVAIVDVA